MIGRQIVCKNRLVYAPLKVRNLCLCSIEIVPSVKRNLVASCSYLLNQNKYFQVAMNFTKKKKQCRVLYREECA